MDRGEVLFSSWLSIITVWAFALLDAVFSNFTSAWREFVVGTATLVGVVLGCVVALGYLFWPSESARQAKNERERIKRHMAHSLSEMEADRLRDSGPFLRVVRTEVASEEEVKTLLIRFPHGKIREHNVRFYYVTIKNDGTKTADDVYANSGIKRMRFVPFTGKSTFGIDFDDEPPEEFDKRGNDGFVVAIMRDQMKVKDTVNFVHPGSKDDSGHPFVLFFTLEGSNDGIYIPSNTVLWRRVHRDRTLKLPLLVTARDTPEYRTLFEVKLTNWKTFEVRQFKHADAL